MPCLDIRVSRLLSSIEGTPMWEISLQLCPWTKIAPIIIGNEGMKMLAMEAFSDRKSLIQQPEYTRGLTIDQVTNG